MSTSYLVGLATTVAVILGAGVIGSRRFARALPAVDAALLVMGLAGLVFHCGAMFFASSFHRLPGTDGAIEQINALGGVSIAWYVIGAGLVAAGLHRQSVGLLALLGAGLVAVGITMFDDGSVHVHLTAIFTTVAILSGVLAFLVKPSGFGAM